MSTKTRVLIEADANELFDAMKRMKGDASGIGERLSGILMTGKLDWRETLALEVAYGIRVISADTVSP